MTATLPEDVTVAEVAIQFPAAIKVFEKHGIDYCCNGRRPLSDAAGKLGLSVEKLLAEIERTAPDEKPKGSPCCDWAEASLAELCDHIVETHHNYLRVAMPRLSELSQKVAKAHGPAHPGYVKLSEVYGNLRAELESHMAKEERILFPITKEMEKARENKESLPPFHCGSISNPIGVMMDEHEFAGNCLEAIAQLTDQFKVPCDGCPTLRAMFQGLQELTGDLHQHIHLENNILFPRAMALEASFEG